MGNRGKHKAAPDFYQDFLPNTDCSLWRLTSKIILQKPRKRVWTTRRRSHKRNLAMRGSSWGNSLKHIPPSSLEVIITTFRMSFTRW